MLLQVQPSLRCSELKLLVWFHSKHDGLVDLVLAMQHLRSSNAIHSTGTLSMITAIAWIKDLL